MKVVLKLDLHDDKAKQKALKAVSGRSGIDSITMYMKEKKLTVIGAVDPVEVVSKLKKKWHTEILTVGPAKEPEKKKDEPKKEEAKKEEGKKEDDKKKKEEQQIAELVKAYEVYNPHLIRYYHMVSMEENPNMFLCQRSTYGVAMVTHKHIIRRIDVMKCIKMKLVTHMSDITFDER